MATSFDAVEDLALVVISDYKLDNLYRLSQEDFQRYCDSFLVTAINDYNLECDSDLGFNLSTRQLDKDLNSSEMKILADFWGLAWFMKEVQDSTQFSLKLTSTGGFQTHSEAQNLKEKSAWADKLRERISQKIVDYQLKNFHEYLS